MYGPIDKSDMAKFGIVETPLMKLTGTRGGLKIQPIQGGTPIARLDFDHHEFGDQHLQFGEKTFTGRKGNEAADIFAEILRLNPKIKFPGEDEE
jgi:hypothetical protein